MPEPVMLIATLAKYMADLAKEVKGRKAGDAVRKGISALLHQHLAISLELEEANDDLRGLLHSILDGLADGRQDVQALREDLQEGLLFLQDALTERVPEATEDALHLLHAATRTEEALGGRIMVVSSGMDTSCVVFLGREKTQMHGPRLRARLTSAIMNLVTCDLALVVKEHHGEPASVKILGPGWDKARAMCAPVRYWWLEPEPAADGD